MHDFAWSFMGGILLASPLLDIYIPMGGLRELVVWSHKF